MSYRLFVLDIDGTLRPRSCNCVPRATAKAVTAVQKAGVKVAIATGRGRVSVPKELLNGIRPDYWICSAGADVQDAKGTRLQEVRMTSEQMYALVDFFENYEYPLRFIFSDGSYAYLGYEEFLEWSRTHKIGIDLKDGMDQDRHLIDMPFTAFGWLPREAAARFQEKYGYLGLRFLFDGDTACDILPPEVDKGHALTALLETLGLTAADCVAVGDGDNDAGMLQAAGLGVAVENGSEAAKAAAARLCAPADQGGLEALCLELWPQAFGEAPVHG